MTREHAVDGLHHVGIGGHDNVYFHLHLELHDVDHTHVGGVSHRDGHGFTLNPAVILPLGNEQGYHLVGPAQVFGQVGIGFGVQGKIFKLYVRNFKLLGENLHQPFLGHELQVHQSTAQTLARLLLIFQSLV